MFWTALNYGSWWNWYSADSDGYPGQNVGFDGPTKTIFVAAGVTTLNVQVDLYSAWKEWNIASEEAPEPRVWDKAFTAVGGDPITEEQSLGTTYFLENGWRIQPYSTGSAYTLTVEGNLYTREQGENPFLFANGVSVSLVRSNIVDLITVEAASVNITQDDINAIADGVWDEQVSDHQLAGSTGKKLKDNLKKTSYIARI